jgi:hypothetical protein
MRTSVNEWWWPCGCWWWMQASLDFGLEGLALSRDQKVSVSFADEHVKVLDYAPKPAIQGHSTVPEELIPNVIKFVDIYCFGAIIHFAVSPLAVVVASPSCLVASCARAPTVCQRYDPPQCCWGCLGLRERQCVSRCLPCEQCAQVTQLGDFWWQVAWAVEGGLTTAGAVALDSPANAGLERQPPHPSASTARRTAKHHARTCHRAHAVPTPTKRKPLSVHLR